MRVTILNPEESKKLFYWWGQASKICYDTKMDDPTPNRQALHDVWPFLW